MLAGDRSSGSMYPRLVPPPADPSPTHLAATTLYLCAQVDGATLAGIRRQYGDFLYAKRDYDAAMEQ